MVISPASPRPDVEASMSASSATSIRLAQMPISPPAPRFDVSLLIRLPSPTTRKVSATRSSMRPAFPSSFVPTSIEPPLVKDTSSATILTSPPSPGPAVVFKIWPLPSMRSSEATISIAPALPSGSISGAALRVAVRVAMRPPELMINWSVARMVILPASPRTAVLLVIRLRPPLSLRRPRRRRSVVMKILPASPS